MNVDKPKMAQQSHQSNRLSERRGLGSFTLNQEDTILSETSTLHNRAQETGTAKEEVNQERKKLQRNPKGVSLETEKMSYFRSIQQQDGAKNDVVTVEELSRDCPPAGLSPASSPSSKYRASLPGCSPRWPHTYHDETIFSFPSSPSSLASSSTSYKRRRPLYPFSSVGLFACNRYAASRRLSTVIEKPVGDVPSVELTFPIQSCALLVDVSTVLGRSLLNDNSFVSIEKRETSSKSLETPHLVDVSQVWQTATPTVDHSVLPENQSALLSNVSSSSLKCQYNSVQVSTQHPSAGKPNITTTSICQYTELCIVDLPSHHHHQQSAYRVDNNRTTGDFCTNQARVVSLIPSCGTETGQHFPSPNQISCKRGDISSAKFHTENNYIFDSKDSCNSKLLRKNELLNDRRDVVFKPQSQSASFRLIMDKHVSSHGTSMTPLHAVVSPSHIMSVSCTPIDGEGVAASQSPSVAVSQPIFTSHRYVNCKNHEMTSKTCSCEACQKHSITCSVLPQLSESSLASTKPATGSFTEPSRLVSKLTSGQSRTDPNKPVENQSLSLNESRKEVSKLTSGQSRTDPNKPVENQSLSLNESRKEVSKKEVLVEELSTPSRPVRSRSPKEIPFCNAHSEFVRDRRAYSVDPPLVANFPNPMANATEAISKTIISRIVQYPKAKANSSEVEELRQLTQRLRPSSSSNSPSSHSTGGDRLPDKLQSTLCLESNQNQLPPLPVAPPRHPRIRSERKKTSRTKKDSATSTSDLVLPPECFPSFNPQNPSLTVLSDEKVELLEKENGIVQEETTKRCDGVAEKSGMTSDLVSPCGHNSPTNETLNQAYANLFSNNTLKSVVDPPMPSQEDVFDEVHLTLSKLNPRIMVGTYQQRTIPFRSASFSQIDVGADGTYNRRPRTSITLKPVTYSIGRDVTSHPAIHSASLPRRLKISDRNAEENASPSLAIRTTTNSSVANSSASSVVKSREFAETCCDLLDTPPPVNQVQDNSSIAVKSKESNLDNESCETANELKNLHSNDFNCDEPTIWIQNQSGQNPSLVPLTECRTKESNSAETLDDGLLDLNPISDDSMPSAEPKSLLSPLTEANKVEIQTDEVIEKRELAGYETTEVSVSAEIRLSPLPIFNSLETTNLEQTEGPPEAEPLTSSKPLPVLDLLELNNHLLRLRAATRDNTMDRLADLEVAAQFGDIVPNLPANLDSSSSSSRNGLVLLGSSNQLEGRPWLNEFMRIANFDCDESGLNPTEEGFITKPTECSSQNVTSTIIEEAAVVDCEEGCRPTKCSTIMVPDLLPVEGKDSLISLPVAASFSSRDMANKRSPRSGRRNSKRRRHSSFLTHATSNTDTPSTDSYKKVNRGRSLTFPLLWPSNTLSLSGNEKQLFFEKVGGFSFLEDENKLGLANLVEYKSERVAQSLLLIKEFDGDHLKHRVCHRAFSENLTSPDSNSDSFQPVVMVGEQNPIYSKLKCAHAKFDCSCPIELSKQSHLLQITDELPVKNPSLLTSDSFQDDQSVPYGYTTATNNSMLLSGEKHFASVESDEPEEFQSQQNQFQSNLSGTDIDRVTQEMNMNTSSDLSTTGDVKTEDLKENHRLKVSLSVTLAPEINEQKPESIQNTSLSPHCPDLESNNFSLSLDKSQRSPLNPRRYGMKRRPLRGPYGEMLEAEMNKSEFSKMYSKRNEDLSFLRELNPRINREAKSSSPRPLSPPSSGMHIPIDESPTSNWSALTNSVRQSSMTLPTSHSLDDSQLKIGYNSTTLPIEISNSPRHSRFVLPKRKTSASVPYELSDSDFELNSNVTVSNLLQPLQLPSSDGAESKTRILPTLIENGTQIKCVNLTTHQRTSSSPCQLVFNEGGFTSEDEPELLELTSLSSLRRSTAHLLESANQDTLSAIRLGSAKRSRDTRTHAIGELYDTERSYVDSLQILVTKYLQPLKGPECSGLVESNLVDEIFFQIPAILAHHEVFLEELRKRLESWDSKQCVGGVFLDTLTKPPVIETYTAYINHWKHAKEAIKSACSAKTAFSKFLEATAREHKGKLALDSLLIMPVQRIPRYELLIKMLLKHTPREHPDHNLLLDAQKEVHELAVKINCVEREAYGAEQQQATLRELESLVEGLGPGNLVTPERTFIRHDCVTISTALGTRKERGFFLFSDLLVITSVKRRSTAIRKSSSYSTTGIASTLEANKFKLLMRLSLDDLDVTKTKEDGSKRSTKDLEYLEEDLTVLNQITELVSSLHVTHPSLDEAIKDIQQSLQRQLSDKQNLSSDPLLATLDLAISSQDGLDILTVTFTSSEKRASWEESFTETKLRLRAMSPERRPPPEFLMPLPIRKTRAGLQFTCAAPTVTWNTQHLNDVWVCNSDGYVGQVCILSLLPEPNVTSCNGVCNARITCIAAIPAAQTTSDESVNNITRCVFKRDSKFESSPSCPSNEIKSSLCANFELESESSSESSGSEESADDDPSSYNRYRSSSIPLENSVSSASEEVETTSLATMWLGTEDGCIHIYHCGENIRLKKNRTRIQQGAAVLSIVYMDNCVFVSLANGDVLIYQRLSNGAWNINEPQSVTVGSIIGPVTRMLPVSNGIWCTSQNTVKILNTTTLTIDNQFAVSSDSQRSVLSLVSNGLGVWVAMQGSAVVRLFHASTHECICDVNLAPAVNKMLSGCDDIIRQHKAACLRVTSMMVCRDLLWVGTSAGVILTIPIPHLTPTSSRLSSPPCVTGLSHGHTGHVRFLTCVEATRESHTLRSSRLHHSAHHGISLKNKDTLTSVISSTSNVSSHGNRLLVISGGDGYEDFRHSGFSDTVGREDSTNHLLLWQV